MKNILICNQKGGTGKSMIADELAFHYERNNIPISFLDLDGQGGTIHRTNQRDDAQVAIIDTPGALQKQLTDWLRAADIVIIPTRATSRDIEPLRRMMQAVGAAARPDAKVVYVINGFNRWRASRDFLAWFRSQCNADMLIYTIPQSEAIVQAGAAGQSVVDYARHGSIVVAVRDFCYAVQKLAGVQG